MTSRVALGGVLFVTGTLWLLSALDVVDLSYASWIGILLVTIGLAIVLVPGRHGLLAFLGVLVLLAGIPVLLVGSELFQGGIGDQVEAPTAASELEPFRHGIGQLTVDLTSPDLDLDGATVEASLGIGELLVLVPDDTDVSLDASVGVGNVEALERSESGIGVDVDWISGTSGSQELDLQLDVGIGNVRVERRG